MHPLVEQIANLKVSELVALTKDLQTHFGVSLQSAGSAMRPPIVAEEVEVFEPTSFDVYLIEHGFHKIQVIKAVRELVALGLKEAKDLVENSPAPIKTAINLEEAEKVRARLIAEGAIVEIRPIMQ